MSTFVQFEDSTEQRIISIFGCPQDSEFYPHQGELDEDDPRLIAYLEAVPSPVI
jgi:hypothetical protein